MLQVSLYYTSLRVLSLSLFNIFAVLKYMYIHGYQNQLIWNMIEIDKYNNESNVHTLYKLNIVLNVSALKIISLGVYVIFFIYIAFDGWICSK